MATALSWEEIVDRGKQHNKTVICEVKKRGCVRFFDIICDICSYETNNFIGNFNKCRKCALNNRTSNYDDFIYKANIVHPEKYDYNLVEYVNSHTKIKIICNSCNDIFYQKPNGHLSGKGCLNCSLSNRASNNIDFIRKASILHLERYDYSLVEYIDGDSKIKIICNKCNAIFLQKPCIHLKGSGCPKCNESKGEIKVTKCLLEKDIKFTPQKTFQTLRNIKLLKCDFYLEDLNLLNEFDGIGHYGPVYGNLPEDRQKNFEDCQRRDKIKNEWAKANNIPLLRIPYWDFDRIEELIEAFILQHTKKKEIKQLVLEM
jgi:hypothetical protein